MRNIVITIITILLAIGVVTSAPVRQEQPKPLEKIVPLEEDASEAINVATDSAIKQAKKSTKNAIAKMAKNACVACVACVVCVACVATVGRIQKLLVHDS